MKKGHCAVYWLKGPGGMGKVKKRGTRQVCEQYRREQLAKAKVEDAPKLPKGSSMASEKAYDYKTIPKSPLRHF